MPSFSFEITKLIGDNFLVKGTDTFGNEGQTLLTSPRWAAVLRGQRQAKAQEAFDNGVKEFFQPFITLIEEHEDKSTDWSTITVVAPTIGIPGQKVDLDDAGVLLNILSQERGDLLIWVDAHTLSAIEE
jgi:hypothetical protein